MVGCSLQWTRVRLDGHGRLRRQIWEPMYAMGSIPLIQRAAESKAVQSWFSDDATAASSFPRLRCWWDAIEKHGRDYGYYPNASKSVLPANTQHWPVVRPLHWERSPSWVRKRLQWSGLFDMQIAWLAAHRLPWGTLQVGDVLFSTFSSNFATIGNNDMGL